MTYVLIDIDDTIGDLVSVWINRYNRKYNDNLIKENITDWNIANFVKPECGEKIYDFIKTPSIYKRVNPIPLSKEGVSELRQYFDIIFTTSTPHPIQGIKYLWLKEHEFWNEKDHYVETSSKFLIKGSLIIDDNWENILKFSGFGLLFDQPWNKKFKHPNRIHGWEEILDNINKFKEWKNEKDIPN